MEVTSTGEILSENYQSSVPLVLPTDSNDQTNSIKSPRIPIPLSALSTLMQPNQVSFGNAVVDLQQLQAFLMSLQPQINQIPTNAANFDSTATEDATNLSAFQNDCELQCNISETENDPTSTVSTGLMTINDSFANRSLESFESLVKPNDHIALSPRK